MIPPRHQDPPDPQPGPPVQACVIIPVYNHALTVGQVAQAARRILPVITVDDGSTDATPSVLATLEDIERLRLAVNQGKGAALRAGFDRARQLQFTHAITLDADGQHPVSALPAFLELCRRQPSAVVTGVRDFARARAPLIRRTPNALSNLGFRLETGVPLADTQCGYRAYPLAAIQPLAIRAERYAYELELLVRAAWAGIPILSLPFDVDYAAPTSRMSHFDPLRDLARVSRVHARLAWFALTGQKR